ncbi:MAG: hypothetical protein JXR83_15660, partial [Deltaproteobacteria bacterium]|nr:hypothetical protein [Deltaproteobacteria bacterium]
TAIEHDTVLLAAVGVHKNSNDEDVYLMSTQLQLDAQTVVLDELRLQRAEYPSQLCFASALTDRGRHQLTVLHRTSHSDFPAYVENVNLLALRYKEAAAVLGDEETVPP